MKSPSTAILLFSRSAKEEAIFKRVSGKKRLNKRFFKTLIDHTLQTAKSTELPLFTTDNQRGNTFGERLTHALKEVFDQGFERVIAIGNDSPGLTTDVLLQAAHQLNQHELVIGPATDGGTYLVGLHKDAFDQETLAQLQWSNEGSFEDLMAFANSKGLSTYVGNELQDIDNRNGLHLLLNLTGIQFRSLKTLVANLLAIHEYLSQLEGTYQPSPLRFGFGLKAPPLS